MTLSNKLLARIEGRSTLARFGLVVHNTAPTIQPGFDGVIALELTNVGPINLTLSNDLVVCQLIIEALSSPAGQAYSEGKAFQHQKPQK